MKVAFLLECTLRRQAYIDVVKAGDGHVVQNFSIEEIINGNTGKFMK